MKKFNSGPTRLRRAIGNLLTQRRIAAVGLAMTACLTATAVPSNLLIDVSAPGGTGTTASGAIFSYNDPQPTGTGFIDPFLREQNTGTELGVNTSIKAQTIQNTILYDNKDPVNYTHDLAISTLSVVNGHYSFALDANQVNNGPISLTTFKIFVSSTAITDTTVLNALISGTPVFNMNDASHTYRVDISTQHGSGSGDMTVLVPTAGIAGNNFLYLVAGFSELSVPSQGSGFAPNDGFEEWTAKTGVPPPPGVPDGGSTLLLLGSAFASLGFFARGRKTASIA